MKHNTQNKKIKKLAIVGLVRGYEDINDYDILIARNKSILNKIVSKLKIPYKVILFHEGNINDSQQNYIIKQSFLDMEFINVEKDFKFDKSLITKTDNLERFNSGYRMMCRFNFYSIWKYVKDYEFVLRIDEDVIFKRFNIKKFEKLLKNNEIFSTVRLSKETHSLTNRTLPKYLQEVLMAKDLKFYNNKFPYTNFYFSRVDFWTNPEIQKKLQKLVTDEQFIYRWGDLPIIGAFLNHYKVSINLFRGTSYYNQSHKHKLIKSTFLNF
jgi:hypothetical protein